MKLFAVISAIFLSKFSYATTVNCPTEKLVATAWIEGHLSLDDKTFNETFSYIDCQYRAGYQDNQPMALTFESASTFCAVDVDSEAQAVLLNGDTGCFQKIINNSEINSCSPSGEQCDANSGCCSQICDTGFQSYGICR